MGKSLVMTDAVEARCRAFLIAKEHRQVIPGGIVHRDYPVPAMAGYPFLTPKPDILRATEPDISCAPYSHLFLY